MLPPHSTSDEADQSHGTSRTQLRHDILNVHRGLAGTQVGGVVLSRCRHCAHGLWLRLKEYR